VVGVRHSPAIVVVRITVPAVVPEEESLAPIPRPTKKAIVETTIAHAWRRNHVGRRSPP
jgi:hypothetical protein